MRFILTLSTLWIIVFTTSCQLPTRERKAVPPTSTSSKKPWNDGLPGEGGGQFNHMLDRR